MIGNATVILPEEETDYGERILVIAAADELQAIAAVAEPAQTFTAQLAAALHGEDLFASTLPAIFWLNFGVPRSN